MTRSHIKYLGDIIVVILAAPREASSGIVLPENHTTARIREATIVAVGSKCVLPVKAGDTVLVDTYIGTRKTINKQDVVVYDSEDVISVVMS